jgi:putative DNA primase/helicase
MNEATTIVESLISVCLADLENKPVNWLWKSYFARGKVSLLVGDPGIGKSFATVDLAARVTRGQQWPDKQPGSKPASVVIMSAEDDAEDTIRPRAECAGANMSRLHHIQGVAQKASVTMAGKTIAKNSERGFDLASDLPLLREKLRRLKDVALVIIDPLTAYQPRINSDKNNEVRASLVGLQMLAKEFDIAVLAIMHLTKSEQAAIYRVSGSVAYTALARTAFVVTMDRNDPMMQTHLFLPLKTNIGAQFGNGLSFSFAPAATADGIELVSIDWTGPSSISAGEALALSKPRREDGASAERLEDAKDFLTLLLADGPKPVKEVEEDAKQNGIKLPTLNRARRALGVEASKPEGAFANGWVLSLRNGGPSLASEASQNGNGRVASSSTRRGFLK